MDEDVSRFLLDLYRASREIPHAVFKDWIFDRLDRLIRFDSGWWGTGSEQPLKVHRVHLHRCDPRILEVYPKFIDQDCFREAVSRSPGRVLMSSDLMNRADFEQTAMYRELGKAFRVEWPMGAVLIEPVSSLNEFITIWRHEVQKPFSESDRQILQAILPHLCEANRVCRVNQIADPGGLRRAKPWALCDSDGLLHDLGPSFVDLVREEWRDWHDAALPCELHAGIVKSRRYIGRRIVIEARDTDEQLLLLKGRWRSTLDELSPRELEVAQRYARGDTYAVIARERGVAPSTVRNQLYRVFRKIHVNNKTELAMRLFESSGAA